MNDLATVLGDLPKILAGLMIVVTIVGSLWKIFRVIEFRREEKEKKDQIEKELFSEKINELNKTLNLIKKDTENELQHVWIKDFEKVNEKLDNIQDNVRDLHVVLYTRPCLTPQHSAKDCDPIKQKK